MSDWIELNPNDIIPTAFSGGVIGGSVAYRNYLDTVKATIESARALQALLNPATPDVIQQTIKAIVDTVTGVLQAGKIHVLFIPIAKTFPVKIPTGLPPTLIDMALLFGATPTGIKTNADQNAVKAYATAVSKGGGNAGFLQAFVSSLIDELDPNRPQYLSDNDAVAMTVVLGGSATFSGAIDVAMGLNRIFRAKGNNDLTARILPTPQDLQAKTIGVPDGTRIGVRLDWTAPKTQFTGRYFPGVVTTVKRFAVIRSTDARTMSATSVLDLFPTRDLTTGLESTDKKHKVLVVGTSNTSTWIDNDTLDANKSYYYAVAWELEIAEEGTITSIPFERLSSVVKTRVKDPVPTQNSAPPDWISSPAALQALPALAQQVNVLLERLKVLSERRIGIPNLLNGALDGLITSLEKQIERIDDINQQLAQLSVAFSQPLPALYTTAVTGLGGNAKLVADLSARLYDTSDPNRPPYDGNEYVTGVCLVAGGPRLPDIQPIIDLFNLLFATAATTNPLVVAMNDINAVIAITETATFGPDMKPLPTNTNGTVTVAEDALPRNPDGSVDTSQATPNGTSPETYSVDPSSIDPATGLVAATPRPVIGEDGTSLETLDPTNPTAGQANPCKR